MHLIIAYHDGRRAEAMVLAASTERLRISIPGCDDAMELRVEGDGWITENGERVEIESMIRAEEWSISLPKPELSVRGAGGNVS